MLGRVCGRGGGWAYVAILCESNLSVLSADYWALEQRFV